MKQYYVALVFLLFFSSMVPGMQEQQGNGYLPQCSNTARNTAIQVIEIAGAVVVAGAVIAVAGVGVVIAGVGVVIAGVARGEEAERPEETASSGSNSNRGNYSNNNSCKLLLHIWY